MKELMRVVILGLLLSGCATFPEYQAETCLVYHAYLDGKISYAEYLEYYRWKIEQEWARDEAWRRDWSNAMKQWQENMRQAEINQRPIFIGPDRYRAYPDGFGGYWIERE